MASVTNCQEGEQSQELKEEFFRLKMFDKNHPNSYSEHFYYQDINFSLDVNVFKIVLILI